MSEDLFALVVEKYATLSLILDDFLKASTMLPSQERDVLLDNILERTNHTGIHFTSAELYRMFLGSGTIHV